MNVPPSARILWIASSLLLSWSSFAAASDQEEAACAQVTSFVEEKVRVPPDYPYGAGNRSIQGWLIVEFWVATDGRAREPRILYASTPGVFDEGVMRATLRSEFIPATRDGLPVGATLRYSQLFYTDDSGLGILRQYAADIRRRAEGGGPNNQYLHAMILDVGGLGLEPKDRDNELAREWRARAAEGGSPHAQFWLATERLETRCPPWREEGMQWLRSAARLGYMPAQAELVRLSPGDAAQSAAAAQLAERWLALKEKDSDLAAGRALAEALIMANVDIESKVLPLVRKLVSRQDYYPPVFELRAAARARLGQYADAVKDQRKALKMAGDLQWNTQLIEQRLQTYQENKAWERDILPR